jgi:hypothetical protein
VYSVDGMNWKDNGYGWSPREYQKIFCYEGTTTCNQWYKMERPGVVLQDGHPTHITWAVADVDKDNQVLPGSNHGTKIIVIPFDGVSFDNDFGVDGGSAGAGGTSNTGGAGGNATAGTGGLSNGGSTTIVAGTGGQATGGSSNVAGAAATGGASGNSAGGQLAAGSPPAVAGASGLGASNPDAGSDDGGCGCRVAGRPVPSKSLVILGLLGLLGRRRFKRRNKQ